MKNQSDRVFTRRFNRSLGHRNFRTLDRDVSGLQQLGDVDRTDRTKQLTLLSHQTFYGQTIWEQRSLRFCRFATLRVQLRQLSPALFNLFFGIRARRHSFALRDKVISAIPGLDVYDVSQVA